MLFSNNEVILQSEGGEGVKKGQKIAVILNGPQDKKNYLSGASPLDTWNMLS